LEEFFGKGNLKELLGGKGPAARKIKKMLNGYLIKN